MSVASRILLASWILASCAGVVSARAATDDGRQAACKAAMNARIQACTDDCTKAALKAASDYVDTNNNVKFGCLKGCAIRQVMQLQGCGTNGASNDPTETNR